MGDGPTKTNGFWAQKLTETFSSESVDERIRVVQECATCVSPDVAEILSGQLARDPSAFVRATIVKSLAAVADGTYLNAVLGAFDDEDDRVRANAIEALEHYACDERTLPYAIRHIHDTSARVRANARTYLEKAEETACTAAVRAMLQSERNDFKLAALRFIEQSEGLKLVLSLGVDDMVALLGPLREVLSQNVRYRALSLIKRMVGEGMEEARALLSDDDSEPSDEEDGPPATTVADPTDTIDMKTRRGRLYHPDAEKRLAEVRAIVGQELKKALPLLRERCLVEEDPLVIKHLIDGLRRLGGSSERDFLLGSLAAGPTPVRQAAIDALGALNDKASLDAIEPYMEHESIQLRAAAAAVLCAKGRIPGTSFLGELAEKGDRDSLLCALMTIRRSPDAGRFHQILVGIHDNTDDAMVKSYAQETERDLVRRGLVRVTRIS